MLLHQNVEGGLGGAELPAPQSVLMKLVVDGVRRHVRRLVALR